MNKEEIALQLTLKLLDNFMFQGNTNGFPLTEGYGGTPLTEHTKIQAEIATNIFNDIFEKLNI